MKHWSAMLMLSKDCGTRRKRDRQRERERDGVREQGVKRERPENVAPYLDYRKEKQHERKGGGDKREEQNEGGGV